MSDVCPFTLASPEGVLLARRAAVQRVPLREYSINSSPELQALFGGSHNLELA